MKKYLNGILVDMTSEEEKEIKAIQDAYDGDAEKLEDLRAVRDGMLSNSDWVVTMHKELGTNIPAAWKTYRQALRDLPASSSPKLDDLGNLDMSSVIWPTPPS